MSTSKHPEYTGAASVQMEPVSVFEVLEKHFD